MADEPLELPSGWNTARGEVADLVRSANWGETKLGPQADWSPSLRLAVDIILASAFPMALRWGPDFVLIYNDAYRPILGDKHPWALGRPIADAWAEVWDQIKPAHIAILERKAPAMFAEDLLLRIQRHGETFEDARFTIGYSPVQDPTAPSGVGGVLVTAVETTDRVTAEAALRVNEAVLRESRSYLTDLLSSSAEAFYAVDREGCTTLCNRAFLKMLGFEREEDVIGRKLHDVIHHTHPGGAAYDVADCPIYQCASSGVSATVDDEYFYHLDGTPFPVEYRANPVFRDGVLQGAICTFIDITERRAAEAELANSEAQFRTLAETMPNLVWAADPDGALTWANEQAVRYGGSAIDSVAGTGWRVFVHPDDVAGAQARWVKAVETGGLYETEFRLRRADGVYRWHLGRALPVRDENGVITRWIGANTDIHDQKRTVEALADLNATLEQRVAEQAAERDRLWHTSQDLLAVIEQDGTFKTVNPAWTGILGWSPQDLVGKNHLDFVHPDDRSDSREALEIAIDAPLPAYENRCLHKDGGFRWISWIASNEGGLVYGAGRNITAQKAAETDLAAAQAALRQSQKMEAVGQLTGGIAHDFNNMLAVVIGSLELLGRRISGGDARAQRYVEAASDGARRAALLTQRLLAFSRQQPLQPEPIDANKLVAGMSDLLRHSIGADVRLETVLAGGLWRTHADPNQLENVILNLAVNARDAMPGGGRLTIETQNAHLDERYVTAHLGVTSGHYVLIAVSDSGAGMAPDVVEKAFDPFFTTKAVGKGTGLGLSQVYGFVKQSGGHVKIYSEPGHGTTIKIYLPRLHGAGEIEAAEPAGMSLALGDQREVVLVVEDEPAVRQFSLDALAELGYQVLEADGAAAALRLLEAHPEIVLLFTDIIMPDVNGAKLAEQARRMRPDLKVLFTTGYTRNAVVHNGVLDAGVELIGKPFTLEALSTKLRAVLERPE